MANLNSKWYNFVTSIMEYTKVILFFNGKKI